MNTLHQCMTLMLDLLAQTKDPVEYQVVRNAMCFVAEFLGESAPMPEIRAFPNAERFHRISFFWDTLTATVDQDGRAFIRPDSPTGVVICTQDAIELLKELNCRHQNKYLGAIQ